MPAVIIFFERYDDGKTVRQAPPDNTSEIHVFEDDREAIRFSQASMQRPHLVRKIAPERWHADHHPESEG